jgi:hypothetical protein
MTLPILIINTNIAKELRKIYIRLAWVVVFNLASKKWLIVLQSSYICSNHQFLRQNSEPFQCFDMSKYIVEKWAWVMLVTHVMTKSPLNPILKPLFVLKEHIYQMQNHNKWTLSSRNSIHSLIGNFTCITSTIIPLMLVSIWVN